MTEVGRWRLTLNAPNGFVLRVEEIIVWDPDVGSGLDPDVVSSQIGLTFNYADRTRTIYPWNNIIKAEWKPT